MGIPESFRWRSKWLGDGGRLRLSRRALLTAACAGLLRAQKAEVSAFDFSLLDESTVPAELFFVREHFPAPAVSAVSWKLSIGGTIARPVEISLEDLQALAAKVLPVTLECAENQVGGGLVSHAEWTGAPLAALLAKAQVQSQGRFVRLSGADGFSRCIPIEKALDPNTLLAFQMNRERLPANHGFPVRAIVPGWYGMDSVKWLRQVEVVADRDPQQGYERLTRSLLTGTRPAGAINTMQVKSAFSRPLDGSVLTGRRFLIRGAAWAGESRVRRVELSTDGGKSWQDARLTGDPLPYAWIAWTYAWKIPAPGPYQLIVRAEDDHGRTQAAERAPERADPYELNQWQAVQVTVA